MIVIVIIKLFARVICNCNDYILNVIIIAEWQKVGKHGRDDSSLYDSGDVIMLSISFYDFL